MGQCPNCGATTSPDHSFCLQCGVELPAEPQATVLPEAPLVDRPLSPPSAQLTAPSGSSHPGPESAALRPTRQSAGGAAVPAVVAVVVNVVFQALIDFAVPADAYVHRLFRPAGGWIMSVVPALIAFALVWTLTDLVLKLRLARVSEGDLARPEINRVPGLVAQEPISATLQRLRSWDGRLLARPVGRRVLWLLQHLGTTDPQRAHELIRHQADLEADLAVSGHRTVRLFIWAMPILGFIGTVVGISLSVGGFSDFLTTNVSIDEIDRVTAELGRVASGLSFAFDTTLLGLLGGLIASVMSSAVQAREERVLTRLEELGLRIIESATPIASGATSGPSQAGVAQGVEFDQMMHTRLEELSTEMEQFTRAVRKGLDGFLGEWSQLPPEVERVAADLTELRRILAGAAKSTDRLILETRVLLEGLKDASARMSTGLDATIGSVTETVEGLGDNLRGVSDSLAHSVAALSERLTSRDDMLRLSASIAELGHRLGEVRDAQATLAPILSRLAGPLELRLTPTPGSGTPASDD